MNESRPETTLTHARLHWGIFIPALLVVIALAVLTVPLLFIVHMATSAMTQMSVQLHQPAARGLNLIWLVVLIPDFLIVAGLFLGTWLSYSKSEVTLTNRRLVFRTGFLSRRSGELPLENVESIFISEPLFGRMCGYATVMVTSVGGAHFPLSFISSPQSFHAVLQEAVGNAKHFGRPISKPPEASSPAEDSDARYRPKF